MAEDENDLLKKRNKEKDKKDSDLFEELDVDIDSDHPVHESFVDERKIRELKKRIRKI